jgi:hypothetical protein
MVSEPVRMVYGAVAFGFDPSGASLAFIAPKAATAPAVRLSLGPLRILDPGTGTVRALLDAAEIAFFWAPDGKTIAVLQVDLPGGSGLASANAVLAASASPAVPDPGLGLHLRFAEVASGAIRSERQVLLSDLFVTQLLPFFGQYALSHPPPVRVVHLSCSPQRPARSATTRRAEDGAEDCHLTVADRRRTVEP